MVAVTYLLGQVTTSRLKLAQVRGARVRHWYHQEVPGQQDFSLTKPPWQIHRQTCKGY